MNESNSPRRTIEMASLSASQSYFLMISAIVPRPIAWVSSRDRDGIDNLAPFSFFQGVSSSPPILMLAISTKKSSGESKDTLANILATKEFVVGTVHGEQGTTMAASAAEFAAGESEFESLGIETFPSQRIAPPCIAGSGVNLECRLRETHEIGNSVAIFGEILLAHVREELLDTRGVVDADRLRPLGRLGGSLYLPYTNATRL